MYGVLPVQQEETIVLWGGGGGILLYKALTELQGGFLKEYVVSLLIFFILFQTFPVLHLIVCYYNKETCM